MKKQDEILEILKKKGVINSEKVLNINKEIEDGKVLDDILVNKKYIKAEDLAKLKSDIFHLPYISLLEERIDSSVLNTISAEVSENYKIVCFGKKNKILKIGITDPDNFKAIEAVDFLAKGEGFHVEFHVISNPSFESVFKQYKTLDEELSSALQKREEDEALVLEEKEKEDTESKGVTKSAPVTKIVTVIIRQAVDGGASDIHIEPMQKETRIRYRVDGILKTSLVLPRSVHNAIVARIKVMASLKLDETRIPQDGRIRVAVGDKEVDFRVSILPLIKAEKVVMRILNTDKGAPSLKDLGFEGIQYDVIKNNLKKTEGMLLVTGPTGSGKSTTLFSILDILNKEGINISTLEDPVEYQMKGVNQSQIKPEIGYTFAAGLRSFLRQDPDVIMVGEIRDEETAELAIHAALTGHSVLSTLHTTSAIGSIPRFVDMGIEPFLLSSTLHTVVAQRLARRICPHCIKEEEISLSVLNDIKEDIARVGEEYMKKLIPDFSMDKIKCFKGAGCNRCGNSGYTGRVSIIEVLNVNKEVKMMIADGRKNINLDDVLASQKYITMKEDGIIKVLQGITTMDEVLRVMKD